MSEPDIVLSCFPHEAYINFLFLTIENLGGGKASRISFTLNRDSAEGEIRIQELGLIRNGLGFLGPHQRVVTYFANLTDIEALKDRPLEINVKFYSTGGQEYKNTFIIDYSQFEGLSSIGKPPIYELAEYVKTLTNIMRSVESNGKINVVRLTPEDEEVSRYYDTFYRKWRSLTKPQKTEVSSHVDELAKANATSPSNIV